MPEATKERKDSTPQDAERKAESLEEKKRRIAQVLDRGLVNHRLEVKNPDPDRRYAFIRDREEDIDKYKALGYRVDTAEGKDRGLHSDGDSKIRVGDVIRMSTSRENHELIQEVYQEQARRKMSAGKREYFKKAEGHAVPVIGDEPEV